MSNTAKIKFKTRESRSKGSNNALINDGYLLGNIVEKGKESISVAFKRDDFRKALNSNGINAIYTLEDGENNSHTLMIKDIQIKPVTNEFHHVDFQVVALDVEITVEVLINIVGQASVESKGYIINRNYDAIPVTGFPQDIPDTITVDVTGFDLDSQALMSDIELDKVKSELDDDELIISVSEPKIEEEDDEDAEEIDVEVEVIDEVVEDEEEE